MDGCIDGLVLAATIADDPRGDAVLDGLAPGLARRVEARLAALAALDAKARRAEVTRLAAQLQHVPEGAALPPRAAALLASRVPREVGRRWLAAAPVRRGYRAPAALRALLHRVAAEVDPDAGAAEREAAGAVDVAFTPAQAASLRRWADRLVDDPSDRDARARALGALALGARGSGEGDATSRRWRRIGAEIAEAWEAAWRA